MRKEHKEVYAQFMVAVAAGGMFADPGLQKDWRPEDVAEDVANAADELLRCYLNHTGYEWPND